MSGVPRTRCACSQEQMWSPFSVSRRRPPAVSARDRRLAQLVIPPINGSSSSHHYHHTPSGLHALGHRSARLPAISAYEKSHPLPFSGRLSRMRGRPASQPAEIGRGQDWLIRRSLERRHSPFISVSLFVTPRGMENGVCTGNAKPSPPKSRVSYHVTPNQMPSRSLLAPQ